MITSLLPNEFNWRCGWMGEWMNRRMVANENELDNWNPDEHWQLYPSPAREHQKNTQGRSCCAYSSSPLFTFNELFSGINPTPIALLILICGSRQLPSSFRTFASILLLTPDTHEETLKFALWWIIGSMNIIRGGSRFRGLNSFIMHRQQQQLLRKMKCPGKSFPH